MPVGLALSSATKVVDLSQKSTWGSTRATKNFFLGGSRMCSPLTARTAVLRTIQASFAAFSLVPGTEFQGFICGCPYGSRLDRDFRVDS